MPHKIIHPLRISYKGSVAFATMTSLLFWSDFTSSIEMGVDSFGSGLETGSLYGMALVRFPSLSSQISKDLPGVILIHPCSLFTADITCTSILVIACFFFPCHQWGVHCDPSC